MDEFNYQFESRKKDHLQWSLSSQAQSESFREFEQIQLIPEALPDLNLQDVSTRTTFVGHEFSMPLFISSMTAGHKDSTAINAQLARLSQRKQIIMGVGSQRRELQDPNARQEWKEIRKQAPSAFLIGNLGLSQVIQTPISEIQKLIENLQAQALFVHLNSLQECLQKEGTPSFRGGWKALENVCKHLGVPVIIKEVGCGISLETARRLMETGVIAVDVSGAGGTHWGRIETLRYSENEVGKEIGESFADWGLSTVESLLNAKEAGEDFPVWASGGVRNGVEAMKLLSLGADFVGMARPWLLALHQVDAQLRFQLLNEEKCEESLDRLATRLQRELQIALFCTGCANLSDLKKKKVWQWKNRSQMFSKASRN